MAVPRGAPCTIPDCGKPVVGRGWCARHYGIWRTHGDPLHPVRSYERRGEKCADEGCPDKPDRKGLCHKHATRLEKHGTTMDPRERRFWAKVDRRGEDECWEWAGARQPNGYGVFGMTGTRLVHRIAYQYLVGAIPDRLVLDHLCHTRDTTCADNAECPHRRCVNPAHLEPVTRRENIRRGNQGAYWGYVPEQRKPKASEDVPLLCKDCGQKPPYKRGICRPCYRRWLKDPSVERPSKRTTEQRFWAKVEKTGSCWLWTASVNAKTGYGRFGPKHGQMMDAHRFSYLLAHGKIPPGADVHHTCHVRRCVNPGHLQAVSRSENLRMRKVRRT
jgi:hypothetical protein